MPVYRWLALVGGGACKTIGTLAIVCVCSFLFISRPRLRLIASGCACGQLRRSMSQRVLAAEVANVYILQRRCADVKTQTSVAGSDAWLFREQVKLMLPRSFNFKGGRIRFDSTLAELRGKLTHLHFAPECTEVLRFLMNQMAGAFVQNKAGTFRPHLLVCGAVLGLDSSWVEHCGGVFGSWASKKDVAQHANSIAKQALAFMDRLAQRPLHRRWVGGVLSEAAAAAGDVTIVEETAAPAAAAGNSPEPRGSASPTPNVDSSPKVAHAAGGADTAPQDGVGQQAAPAAGCDDAAPQAGGDQKTAPAADCGDTAPQAGHGTAPHDVPEDAPSESPRKRKSNPDSRASDSTPPPKRPPASPEMPTPEADPYTVLGVSISDGYSAVRTAYRKLALQTHPDKGGNPRQFRAVQKAWEILSEILHADQGNSASELAHAGGGPVPSWGSSSADGSSSGSSSSGHNIPPLSKEELDKLMEEYLAEMEADLRKKIASKVWERYPGPKC